MKVYFWWVFQTIKNTAILCRCSIIRFKSFYFRFCCIFVKLWKLFKFQLFFPLISKSIIFYHTINFVKTREPLLSIFLFETHLGKVSREHFKFLNILNTLSPLRLYYRKIKILRELYLKEFLNTFLYTSRESKKQTLNLQYTAW